MCGILKISRSSYYAWLNRKISLREKLKTEIKRDFELSKKRYGSPRITFELNSQGIKVSKPLVSKLVQELGLRSIVKKKFISYLYYNSISNPCITKKFSC